MATVERGVRGGREQGPLEFKELAQGAIPPQPSTPDQGSGCLRLKESEPPAPHAQGVGHTQSVGAGVRGLVRLADSGKSNVPQKARPFAFAVGVRCWGGCSVRLPVVFPVGSPWGFSSAGRLGRALFCCLFRVGSSPLGRPSPERDDDSIPCLKTVSVLFTGGDLVRKPAAAWHRRLFQGLSPPCFVVCCVLQPPFKDRAVAEFSKAVSIAAGGGLVWWQGAPLKG